jgi:hypothetical protein
MARIPEDPRVRPWRQPPDPREVIRRQDQARLAQLRAERLAEPMDVDEMLRRTALYERGR